MATVVVTVLALAARERNMDAVLASALVGCSGSMRGDTPARNGGEAGDMSICNGGVFAAGAIAVVKPGPPALRDDDSCRSGGG